MSPRTFKSCPDIHILPRHSTLTHFKCLPGHSNLARTFIFYPDICILHGHSVSIWIWMSAWTFKSCPDIQVFIDSECLPGHSNFARTFRFYIFWTLTHLECLPGHSVSVNSECLPGHSTLTHIECLPRHSHFAQILDFEL